MRSSRSWRRPSIARRPGGVPNDGAELASLDASVCQWCEHALPCRLFLRWTVGGCDRRGLHDVRSGRRPGCAVDPVRAAEYERAFVAEGRLGRCCVDLRRGGDCSAGLAPVTSARGFGVGGAGRPIVLRMERELWGAPDPGHACTRASCAGASGAQVLGVALHLGAHRAAPNSDPGSAGSRRGDEGTGGVLRADTCG